MITSIELPVPARLRPVRRLGLLPCCIEYVSHTNRPTTYESELQCGVCRAIMRVDSVGAWVWAGPSGPIHTVPLSSGLVDSTSGRLRHSESSAA